MNCFSSRPMTRASAPLPQRGPPAAAPPLPTQQGALARLLRQYPSPSSDPLPPLSPVVPRALLGMRGTVSPLVALHPLPLLLRYDRLMWHLDEGVGTHQPKPPQRGNVYASQCHLCMRYPHRLHWCDPLARRRWGLCHGCRWNTHTQHLFHLQLWHHPGSFRPRLIRQMPLAVTCFSLKPHRYSYFALYSRCPDYRHRQIAVLDWPTRADMSSPIQLYTHTSATRLASFVALLLDALRADERAPTHPVRSLPERRTAA
jgi:hypothetical protein